MRALRFSIILGSILLLIGCVRSKHPLFTKSNLIFDHSLVGTWSNGHGDSWQFRRKNGNKYLLIRKIRGEKMSYLVEVGKIDSTLFMDAYPLTSARIINIYTKLVPVHLYIKFKINQNKLFLYPIDEQWLRYMAIHH